MKSSSITPSIFIGHGNPMNAIELNEFSLQWQKLGESLPKPTAILCVSAHWETRGSFVTGVQKPKTIHDFYGFPRELYEVEYRADGSPELAKSIAETIQAIEMDMNWGYDHGTWSILDNIYPEANIPVLQLSIDYTKSMQQHFELAQELKALRRKGVLIIGSGNMVHNLGMMSFKGQDFNAEYGYDWAMEINETMKQKIAEGDASSLIKYQQLSKDHRLAIPSLEHYVPMIYSLGLREKEDEVHFFNDKIIAGSLSMTSFMLG